MNANVGSYTTYERKCIEALINAGYRKINPMTEDEFVEAYWEILGAYNARELYQLGFRQLDQGEPK